MNGRRILLPSRSKALWQRQSRQVWSSLDAPKRMPLPPFPLLVEGEPAKIVLPAFG